jgi:hypothetical protein
MANKSTQKTTKTTRATKPTKKAAEEKPEKLVRKLIAPVKKGKPGIIKPAPRPITPEPPPPVERTPRFQIGDELRLTVFKAPFPRGAVVRVTGISNLLMGPIEKGLSGHFRYNVQSIYSMCLDGVGHRGEIWECHLEPRFEYPVEEKEVLDELQYYCDKKRHLICLPYSTKNLHRMAADLGIGRHFYHTGKGHYDIPKRRIEEVTARCTVISSKEILTHIKNGQKNQESNEG